MEEPQLQRLRYALRSFYRYLREEDRQLREAGERVEAKVSWQLIYEDIAHHAAERGMKLDYANGKDRLRAFAAGDADRKNPGFRKFATPNDDLLEAIIEFVADEDTPCVRVTREELQASEFDWDAPVRLCGYLQPNFEPARRADPKRVEGTYRAHEIDEDDLIVRDITIHDARDDGIFRAAETQDSYTDIDVVGLGSLLPEALQEKRLSRFMYEGWGILTVEMGIIMFLKETGTGMNRYYQVLSSSLTIPDRPVGRFIVLHQDFPFEPRAGDKTAMADLADELRHNLLAFVRYDDV